MNNGELPESPKLLSESNPSTLTETQLPTLAFTPSAQALDLDTQLESLTPTTAPEIGTTTSTSSPHPSVIDERFEMDTADKPQHVGVRGDLTLLIPSSTNNPATATSIDCLSGFPPDYHPWDDPLFSSLGHHDALRDSSFLDDSSDEDRADDDINYTLINPQDALAQRYLQRCKQLLHEGYTLDVIIDQLRSKLITSVSVGQLLHEDAMDIIGQMKDMIRKHPPINRTPSTHLPSTSAVSTDPKLDSPDTPSSLQTGFGANPYTFYPTSGAKVPSTRQSAFRPPVDIEAYAKNLYEQGLHFLEAGLSQPEVIESIFVQLRQEQHQGQITVAERAAIGARVLNMHKEATPVTTIPCPSQLPPSRTPSCSSSSSSSNMQSSPNSPRSIPRSSGFMSASELLSSPLITTYRSLPDMEQRLLYVSHLVPNDKHRLTSLLNADEQDELTLAIALQMSVQPQPFQP